MVLRFYGELPGIVRELSGICAVIAVDLSGIFHPIARV